jgi:BirA family biotin operon repressor/biotin-[acetyl-CoA-carboxylase] ligase
MLQQLGDLSRERIQAQLHTARFGRSLALLENTGSTNDDARAAALAGAADGHTLVADAQTRGRGAHGRSWVSPPGVDLYVSVLAQLAVPLERLPPLTLAVGLAVADTCDAFLAGQPGAASAPPVRAHVKWPNDVWIERRKCAGVLVEGHSQGGRSLPVVIGIGLNVNRREFPAGLDNEPTSLLLARGEPASRSDVLALLLDNLERWVDRFVALGPAPMVEALDARLALRNERVRVDDLEGVVEGVAASGALRLRTAGGVLDVLSGTLRPYSAGAPAGAPRP